jgi:N-hydroxyarylamine O-acetyltransferase
MLTDKQITEYLDKIHYDKPICCNEETLKSLQAAHLKHIPYENLDILNGVPLSLDVQDLYRKIVQSNRGGYCFELQGLYAHLLTSLGFQVTQYAGRFMDEPGITQMRRHRILVVDILGIRYLCDVGVRSESPRHAIKLECGLIQTDGISEYRFDKNDFYGWILMQKEKNKGWKPIYGFTEEPQLDIDYVMPSFFCEKHPDSTFNKFMKISIFTDDSNYTIVGSTYKVYRNAKVVERIELKKREVILDILWNKFNIRGQENKFLDLSR